MISVGNYGCYYNMFQLAYTVHNVMYMYVAPSAPSDVHVYHCYGVTLQNSSYIICATANVNIMKCISLGFAMIVHA